MLHEIIQRSLAHDGAAGADTDPNKAAALTVRAVQLLLVEIEPLVGVQAAQALYRRSLQLAHDSCDWLALSTAEPAGERLAGLQRDLLAHAPADARHAGETLLQTFADLLISLIGEPLTSRLLRSAWDTPAADEPPPERFP